MVGLLVDISNLYSILLEKHEPTRMTRGYLQYFAGDINSMSETAWKVLEKRQAVHEARQDATMPIFGIFGC